MYCIQLTQLFSHLWLQTQTPDSQLLPHYDHQNLLPLPWCSSRAHPHKFTGWLAKGLAECRVQYNQWNCRRQFTTACCLMEPPKLKPIPNQPLSNFSNCSFGQSSTLWVCRTVMVVCTCVCRDLVLKTDHIRTRELGHGSMLMSMMVICQFIHSPKPTNLKAITDWDYPSQLPTCPSILLLFLTEEQRVDTRPANCSGMHWISS